MSFQDECLHDGKRNRNGNGNGNGNGCRSRVGWKNNHICNKQRNISDKGCLLGELCPGEAAVVTSLAQESGFRETLLSLWMIPGSRIECVRGGNDSGTCIRIGSSIFMINSYMADLVQVARVS